MARDDLWVPGSAFASMPWTLPARRLYHLAPTPAPALANLVKVLEGRPLGLALGLFKLYPPGGAVTPILQRSKQAQRAHCPKSHSPCGLSHPYPLSAYSPNPDPLALPSESDSPLLPLPFQIKTLEQTVRTRHSTGSLFPCCIQLVSTEGHL